MQSNYRDPRGVLVVGGHSISNLAVVRSFGRRGIPVVYFDSERYSMVRYSRHVSQRLKCQSTRESETEFISELLDYGKQLNCRMMIVPTSDRDVLTFSKYKRELEQFYHLPVPTFETVQGLVNKKSFYKTLAEMQVPHPKTYFPESLTELRSMGREIAYPYIIKPADTFLFQEEFHRKCFEINSPQELDWAVERLRNKELEVVLQEIIPGKELYSLYTYFNRESEPLAICGYDKLRQYPPDFGCGSLCRSAWRSVPIDMAISLLKTVSYHGIAEPEFKRDPRDGEYKLLEINARTTRQSWLAYKCGVSVEYIAYCDILGQPVELSVSPKSGVFWVDDFFDILSCLIQLKEGKLGIGELFGSVKGREIHSVAAWDDPIPLVVQAIHLGFRALRLSLSNLSRLPRKSGEQR